MQGSKLGHSLDVDHVDHLNQSRDRVHQFHVTILKIAKGRAVNARQNTVLK